MPRRKPKNKILPGQPGNPGRPHGATSKFRISEKVREAFEQLLAGAAPHLEDWLLRTAQKHPDKALDLWVKISERFVPSLSRTEITGKDGESFAPITINLPSLPKISAGAPSQNSLVLGDPSPKALLATPVEEVKAVGEGTASAGGESEIIPDLPGDEATGVKAPSREFKIPQMVLSPNQLRDLSQIGETSPGMRPGPEGMGEPVI